MAMSKITAFPEPLLIYGAGKTILIERILPFDSKQLFWLIQAKAGRRSYAKCQSEPKSAGYRVD